ncbi:hypothetical protein SUGI_0969610 [Cryptomeria japonica]|nr:hypothetical protein SUGI_0969610 [Cryptomeria japonica]
MFEFKIYEEVKRQNEGSKNSNQMRSNSLFQFDLHCKEERSALAIKSRVHPSKFGNSDRQKLMRVPIACGIFPAFACLILKVADFGLAKLAFDGFTHISTIPFLLTNHREKTADNDGLAT